MAHAGGEEEGEGRREMGETINRALARSSGVEGGGGDGQYVEYFGGQRTWPEAREKLRKNGNTRAMEHEVERERSGMEERSRRRVRLYSLEGVVATGVSSQGGHELARHGSCFLH